MSDMRYYSRPRLRQCGSQARQSNRTLIARNTHRKGYLAHVVSFQYATSTCVANTSFAAIYTADDAARENVFVYYMPTSLQHDLPHQQSIAYRNLP